MKNHRRILSALLLVIFAAAASTGRSADQGDVRSVVGVDTGFAFSVHAVADYAGSLDPCGCKVPLGGLSRRAGYAHDVAEAFAAAPVISVDAGHMFASISGKDATFVGDPRVRNEWVLKALDYLEVRAANVAPYDIPYLATVMERSGFDARAAALPALARFVSANVVPTGPGLRPFLPFLVVEVAARKADRPVRVAFIGATAVPKGGGAIAGYSIVDPPDAVRKAVAEARTKSDVIVVLAYMGKSEIQRLQNSVAGIDLVMAADRYPRAKSNADLEVPATVTVANEGRYVTDLRVHLGPERRPVKFELRSVALDPQVTDDRAAARLAHEGRMAAEAAAAK